jgi:hypothetical protein
MDHFYSRAGQLLSSRVETSGVAPMRTFTAIFIYERGEARYDGSSWTFKLIN